MGSSAARSTGGKRLTADNMRAGAFGPVRGYCSFLRNSVMGFALSAVLAGGGFAQCRDDRVELRGFGAFSVKKRDARTGRNPRTGEAVEVEEKHVPFFKTGKLLRDRLNGQA